MTIKVFSDKKKLNNFLYLYKEKKMMFATGFLAGVLVMVALMVWFFRTQMVQTFTSTHPFEETVQRTESAIKEAGWGIPGQLDINAMTAKKGVQINNRVHVIELCKPSYAKQVLDDQPQFSAMMPCRFGIYEVGGKVQISKLNTGMMSKFLGGTVAEMMQAVSKEEHIIINNI